MKAKPPFLDIHSVGPTLHTELYSSSSLIDRGLVVSFTESNPPQAQESKPGILSRIKRFFIHSSSPR